MQGTRISITGEGSPKERHRLSDVCFSITSTVDFLQFLRYFTPQAELEEAFIYIIHKPIDFSYRLKI